jgi:hypothetical protein
MSGLDDVINAVKRLDEGVEEILGRMQRTSDDLRKSPVKITSTLKQSSKSMQASRMILQASKATDDSAKQLLKLRRDIKSFIQEVTS